jgi:hypothetical protein
MAYEYGSQQIEIRNPFRLEGVALVVRAVVLIALALYLMLQVKDVVATGARALGWIQMGGGILLLGFGLAAAYQGLFRLFRFYVGRGVPADLASAVSAEVSVMPGAPTGGTTGFRGLYGLKTLADMLLSRKNPTFVEPEGWLPRLLHSVVHNLIFLPWPLRNDAVSLFIAVANGLVLVVLLGLAWFSGVTGLTPVTSTPVMDWLVALVTIALLFIWLREAMRDRRSSARSLVKYSPFRMALWAAIAILLPVGLSALNAAQPLPPVPLSPYPWFFATLVGTAVAFAFALVLATRRAPKDPPPTNVAEYRQHWQESVHPMDIFRAVEMTLAKHRFQDIPNRVYENDVPQLLAQGSQNKGEFAGRTLQEIQPRPVADHVADPLVRAGVVAGQLLLLVSGVCLFYAFLTLDTAAPAEHAGIGIATLLFWILGAVVARSAHLYLSEIEFESDLIAVAITGTFSESKLATGMSIYDSTRSENLVVRCSLSPWVLVSRVHSSILAESGGRNLEQTRYVLGLERNEPLNRELVEDVQGFLRDRQIMAGIQSEGDVQAASTIYQMNERTRGNRPDGGQAPLIPHERREENLLGPGVDPDAEPAR